MTHFPVIKCKNTKKTNSIRKCIRIIYNFSVFFFCMPTFLPNLHLMRPLSFTARRKKLNFNEFKVHALYHSGLWHNVTVSMFVRFERERERERGRGRQNQKKNNLKSKLSAMSDSNFFSPLTIYSFRRI